MTAELQKENSHLHAANSEGRSLLADATRRLSAVLLEEAIEAETPLEASTAMKLAIDNIDAAIAKLKTAALERNQSTVPSDGPTRRQGQFLAFIRDYIMGACADIAPTHSEFQRFFNLTAPSVNSMFIRLERYGFIRRISGKAHAIELTVNPDWIPPIDRPFKFRR
jgi:hypothetical protein